MKTLALVLLLAAPASAQEIVAAPLTLSETVRLRRAYAALEEAQKAVETVRREVGALHPTVSGKPCGFTFSADFSVIVEKACPSYEPLPPLAPTWRFTINPTAVMDITQPGWK